MSRKYFRSGYRFALHEGATAGVGGPRQWERDFYPYEDTAIRYFGDPDSGGEGVWRANAFVRHQDVPANDQITTPVDNYWPWTSSAELLSWIDQFGADSINHLKLIESTEPLESGGPLKKQKSNRIKDQAWLSVELHNESLEDTSLIYEDYGLKSPTRSCLFFDIPEAAISPDHDDTSIQSAKLKLYVHKQADWPTNGVFCEVFLLDPLTDEEVSWTKKNNQGNWRPEDDLLPNPINPEIPLHGERGHGRGGGGIQLITGQHQFPMPEDGSLFFIPNLSTHDFSTLGPFPVEIDVTKHLQWMVGQYPDYDGKLKFIIRAAFWPCPNDETWPTPSPSDGDIGQHTIGKHFTDIGEQEHKKGGGPVIDTGGKGLGDRPPQGAQGPLRSGISTSISGFDSSNPIVLSNNSRENIGNSDAMKVQQSIIESMSKNGDPRYLDTALRTFGRNPTLGLSSEPDMFVVSNNMPYGSGTISEEYDEPDFHPHTMAAEDPETQPKESDDVIAVSDIRVHTDFPHKIQVSPHDHPHPHKDHPEPSPHTHPHPHTEAHTHPHPHQSDPPRGGIEPTWPAEWCYFSGGGLYSEWEHGYDGSGETPWAPDCLYATYFLSREFHDSGTANQSKYGSAELPIFKSDFALTKPSSVMFPDVYYDTVGQYHGINLESTRGSKFALGPYVASELSNHYSLPQCWVQLPAGISNTQDWAIVFIDDENFSISNGLNLAPGLDGANENASITIEDDYFVQGQGGNVFNIKGTHTITEVNTSVASSNDELHHPDIDAITQSSDTRHVVRVMISNTNGWGAPTQFFPTQFPVCRWQGQGGDEDTFGHSNYSNTENIVNIVVFNGDELWDYTTGWHLASELDPADKDFENLFTASSGDYSLLDQDATRQKLRISVSNTNDGANYNDGDSLIIHYGTNGTNIDQDPANAFAIGDKIVIDYGHMNDSTGVPEFGYTSTTDSDTNNQGLYEITWYTLDSLGRRVIGFKDGDVTVAESRSTSNDTPGTGATRIRRYEYLPSMNVKWTSSVAPAYPDDEGLIN
tara:strand:+ start:1970 stop:5068 length:3099 start_codon:yes stop_codon:yes gene_type:complete